MQMKQMIKGYADSMCEMMGVSSKPTEEGKHELANIIAAHPVVIFTKTSCQNCQQTKSLLDTFGAKYQMIEVLRMKPGMLKVLKSETGQKTVPNILIGGNHIGGNSDLQARKSSLKNLLSEAGAL